MIRADRELPDPDDNGLIRSADIHHFHLFDDFHRPNCPPTHIKYPLVASKLVGNSSNSSLEPLTPDADLIPPEKTLITDSDPWSPPLQAVPLASYYKLHRVPSLQDMAEPRVDKAEGVKLPRRESTADPPEQLTQSGPHNKLLDHVIRTPGRQPSPQPTHLSVPGPGPHRVLHEEGPGYVAPKFEGKELQMEQGMLCTPSIRHR